jgi:phosphoribosylanthranilate isomerase
VTHHLRIKVCGVTSPLEARRVAELGADAVGLNFYPASHRYVDPTTALEILRGLPLFVEPVGVFVNEPLRQVFEVLNGLGRVRVFQWHGTQRELSDTFPFPHIAAFPVKDEASLRDIMGYLEMSRGVGGLPAAVLVDAHVPGQHGGTGRTAPWHLLADFQPGVPLILAGGLTPENVAEAVRVVRPAGVDVASGVEAAPGRKDVEKMRRFIGSALEAAARFPPVPR